MSRRNVWIWVFAVVVFVGPPVLTAWIGSENLQAWIGVYVAGAFGALVLELGASRGQLELPSARQRQEDDETKEEKAFDKPLGVQVDLGFFSRMFVGGLAAFAVLLIAKFLASGADTENFPTSADSVATFAWAVAIGFTSPAAWSALKKVAEARYESALAVADEKDKTKRKNAEVAQRKVKHAKQKLQQAAGRPPHERAQREQGLAMALQRFVDDPNIQFRADDATKLVESVAVPAATDAASRDAATALDEASAILETILGS